MELSRQTTRCCHPEHPSIFHAFILLSSILSTTTSALPLDDMTKRLPQPTTSQPTLISPRQSLPSTGNSDNNIGSSSDPGFNYYFIILAAVVAAALGFLFFKSRRRKQRLLLHRASDASGFQNGTPGRGWPTNPVAYAHRQYHNPSRRPAAPRGTRGNRAEGLDERGEAPPPYVPGTKPPSIDSEPGLERVGSSRSVERRRSSVVNDVELGDMTRPSYAPPSAAPPGYHENGNGNGSASSGTGISRPEPAVTSGRGLGSTS